MVKIKGKANYFYVNNIVGDLFVIHSIDRASFEGYFKEKDLEGTGKILTEIEFESLHRLSMR